MLPVSQSGNERAGSIAPLSDPLDALDNVTADATFPVSQSGRERPAAGTEDATIAAGPGSELAGSGWLEPVTHSGHDWMDSVDSGDSLGNGDTAAAVVADPALQSGMEEAGSTVLKGAAFP
jgi:hypothetical protein